MSGRARRRLMEAAAQAAAQQHAQPAPVATPAAQPAQQPAQPADDDSVVDLTMLDDGSETESSESDDSDDSMMSADDDDDDDDDDDAMSSSAAPPAAPAAAPAAPAATPAAPAAAPAAPDEGKKETCAALKEDCVSFVTVETKTSRLPCKWHMAYELLRVGWQHGFRFSHQSESRRFAYVAARYFAQMRAGKDEEAIRLLKGSALPREEQNEVCVYYLHNM